MMESSGGESKPVYHKFPRSRSELSKCLTTWSSNKEELHAEYDRLQDYSKDNLSGDTALAVDELNKSKNRYRDILPYKWRTVKIPVEEPKPGENHNKYINASWILFKGYNQKFIASQAPLEDTIGDFWQCVAHHEVEVIVMLTDLAEGTKKKCAQYWPTNDKAIYSDTEVNLVDEEQEEHYTLRRLQLLQGSDKVREVVQLQVKGWGDYSVPKTTSTLLSLIHRVKVLRTSSPILVHCSAGVGRTGTYIATQRLIENVSQNYSMSVLLGRPNVWDCVVEMRRARPKMVQKSEQYSYIYHCLSDYMAALEPSH